MPGVIRAGQLETILKIFETNLARNERAIPFEERLDLFPGDRAGNHNRVVLAAVQPVHVMITHTGIHRVSLF